MFDRFLDDQERFINLVTESVNNNKISHAYLIETNGYDKGLDLAIAFSKFLLSKNNNVDISILNNMIDSNSYNDLLIINPEGMWIKKTQISALKNEFLKKSNNDNYRIYILNGADKLNGASANSLLKFLEEPEENIIGILLVDNKSNVLETILSRCQVYSLKSKNYDFSENLINISFNFIRYFEENKYDTLCEIYNLFSKYELNKEEITDFFYLLQDIYMDSIKYRYFKNTKYEEFIDVLRLINDNNCDTDISKKIIIINKFIEYVKVNVLNSFLMDKFIIEMTGGVSND